MMSPESKRGKKKQPLLSSTSRLRSSAPGLKNSITSPKQNNDKATASPLHPSDSKSPDPVGLSGLHFQELSLSEKPLSEALWCQAYTELKANEPQLIKDYEVHQYAQAGSSNPTQCIGRIIEQIFQERKRQQFVITLAGKTLKFRELGAKVLSFIWESRAFISSIASAEPHAALAWAAVSQAFPVSYNT